MVDTAGKEMSAVLELHESSKLEMGIAIANRKDKSESIFLKSKDAPVFFSGSFEFFGIDFDVTGRGNDDEAWMASTIFGSEIVQNKCVSVKVRPVDVMKGEGMVIYICGILIDTCSAISSFFKDKPVMYRLKEVSRKECLDMLGFPPFIKLVVKRMDSKPFLLKEVLEAAMVDVAMSRVKFHG